MKKIIDEFIKFVKRNKALVGLCIVACFIVLHYNLLYIIPEPTNRMSSGYKIICDLSLGVIINFLFYLFQVYIPRRMDEKQYFVSAGVKLNEICQSVEEILETTKFFLNVKEDKHCYIDNTIVYYSLLESENQTRILAKKLDLCEDYLDVVDELKKKIEKVLESPKIQDCEKEFVLKLNEIYEAGFLNFLKIAAQFKFNMSYIYFTDFEKEYNLFKESFEEIVKIVGYKKRIMHCLTDDEIKRYNEIVMDVPNGTKNNSVIICIAREM